ncbi:MAG: hypothetical protein QXW35_02440 [Candidatus Aenigmatarchaeota archaeon]
MNKLEEAYSLEISILKFLLDPKKENFYSLVNLLKNLKFIKTKPLSLDSNKSIYVSYIDLEEDHILFIMYEKRIDFFIGNLLLYIGIILNKIQLYLINLYNSCFSFCSYLKNIIDKLEDYKQKAFEISIRINEDVDYVSIYENRYEVLDKYKDYPYFDSLIKNSLSNHSKYINDIISLLKEFQINIFLY